MRRSSATVAATTSASRSMPRCRRRAQPGRLPESLRLQREPAAPRPPPPRRRPLPCRGFGALATTAGVPSQIFPVPQNRPPYRLANSTRRSSTPVPQPVVMFQGVWNRTLAHASRLPTVSRRVGGEASPCAYYSRWPLGTMGGRFQPTPDETAAKGRQPTPGETGRKFFRCSTMVWRLGGEPSPWTSAA